MRRYPISPIANIVIILVLVVICAVNIITIIYKIKKDAPQDTENIVYTLITFALIILMSFNRF